MNLAELKIILSDQLFMAGLYAVIKDYATNKRPVIEFMYTNDYPNKSRSMLNQQQIDQLTLDGYTVVYSADRIHVSGWPF